MVNLTIVVEDIGLWNERNKWVVEKGEFIVWAGGGSFFLFPFFFKVLILILAGLASSKTASDNLPLNTTLYAV